MIKLQIEALPSMGDFMAIWGERRWPDKESKKVPENIKRLAKNMHMWHRGQNGRIFFGGGGAYIFGTTYHIKGEETVGLYVGNLHVLPPPLIHRRIWTQSEENNTASDLPYW